VGLVPHLSFSGKAARAAEPPRQLCLERAILHNRTCPMLDCKNVASYVSTGDL
jgi:hypothetical protein